ncbi:thioesterase II family protein [Nocardia sp. NBC_01327]|uniref:thioesterase II family protein n=1 Tax=Nocardia sp. NBC_01327 TaxID=2903593 RepID=UPI002E1600FE|nr:alpha/beta fold hydrolase [Nocardia sp. NBC_01327]
MTGTEDRIRARVADLPPEQRARLAERLRGRSPETAAAHNHTAAGPDRHSAVWFVRHGCADPAVRLFCFPYAGSGASVFRAWGNHLPADVEVCAIQLPGRESRAAEPAYRRLVALVSDLQAVITPLLDRPFVFFGHSMGALVAFELARQLRQFGVPQPERLCLAAFRAPQLPNPNIRIYHLPDEVLKSVLAKDGTPREVLDDDELMRAWLPMLRADIELCDTYQYTLESPLPMPVSVFGGTHDMRVGRADLEQWKMQAGNEFDLTMLPGSHFFLRDSADLLLAHLSTELQSMTTYEGAPPHE